MSDIASNRRDSWNISQRSGCCSSGTQGWTRVDVPNKTAITVEFGRDEINAVRRLLAISESYPTQQVTRAQFSDSRLDGFLAALLNEVRWGRGLVVLTGLDPAEFDATQLERIFWGIGTHWGNAAQQSDRGDRLGRVRVDPNRPRATGYQSASELLFHSDAYELLALMSLETAEFGGRTRVISSLSIHDELARRSPESLAPLYRGFPFATDSTREAITSVPIPVFSHHDGYLSCMYIPRYMRLASRILKIPIPHDLEAALSEFDIVLNNDRLILEFDLLPGEILFCNNFTHLHARTAFVNGKSRRRSLLRLWLRDAFGRPFSPTLYERGAFYERQFSEQER